MGGKLGKKKGFAVSDDKPKDQETKEAATELEDTAKENGEPIAVTSEAMKNDEGPQLTAEDQAREGDYAVSQGDATKDELVVSKSAEAELPEHHDGASSEAPQAAEPDGEGETSQTRAPPPKEDAEKASATASDN